MVSLGKGIGCPAYYMTAPSYLQVRPGQLERERPEPGVAARAEPARRRHREEDLRGQVAAEPEEEVAPEAHGGAARRPGHRLAEQRLQRFPGGACDSSE